MAVDNKMVVITGGALTTWRLRAWVSVAELASVTLTVKFDVPVAVGVPLMTPVLLFRLRPAGSDPLSMLQVTGLIPPLSASVWL